MREIAGLARFRDLIQPNPRERIGGFADYETALCPPCDHVDLWRTTYVHRLAAPEDVVKWVEGAGLRPYLDCLDAGHREAYLTAYREAVAAAYPILPNGVLLFAFPRLFVVAARG